MVNILSQHWDAIRGKLGQKVQRSVTCPIKKPGSRIFSPKTHAQKKVGLPKTSTTVSYDLANLTNH